MNKKLSIYETAPGIRMQSSIIQSFYGITSIDLPHTEGAKIAFIGRLNTLNGLDITTNKFSMRFGVKPGGTLDDIKITVQGVDDVLNCRPDGNEILSYTGAFPASSSNIVLTFTGSTTLHQGDMIAIVFEWDNFNIANVGDLVIYGQGTQAHNIYYNTKVDSVTDWKTAANVSLTAPTFIFYDNAETHVGYIGFIPPPALIASSTYTSISATNFRGAVYKAFDYCTVTGMQLLSRIAVANATCDKEAVIYRSNGTKIYGRTIKGIDMNATTYRTCNYWLGPDSFDMEPDEEVYFGFEAKSTGLSYNIESSFLPAVYPALPMYGNVGIATRTPAGVWTVDYTKRCNNSLNISAMGQTVATTFRKRKFIGG